MTAYALQIDEGDGYETDVRFGSDDFQEIAELAKAHRADGMKARVGKWCATCERYKENRTDEKCRACAAGIVPADKVVCRVCGRTGHVFCNSVQVAALRGDS